MLTQELVKSLSSEDITKRDYDIILDQIANQVHEIWKYILQKSNRRLNWWGFSNAKIVETHHNTELVDIGYFDRIADAEMICLAGDSTGYSEYYNEDDTRDTMFYPYNIGFATELLWTPNWREIVDAKIADAIEKYNVAKLAKAEKNKLNKQKERDRNQRRRERIKSIEEKTRGVLTPEEYQWLVTKIHG